METVQTSEELLLESASRTNSYGSLKNSFTNDDRETEYKEQKISDDLIKTQQNSFPSINMMINNQKNDPLAEAFKNDKSFQVLLKNGIFDDYFNTFLSLPIFAKRLMYRKNNGVFEIEPPIKRTTHHLLHDKVLSWTRTKRAPLFLKTSICNEYRLCQVLSQLPVCLKDEHFTDEEIEVFQRKYLSRVIDMQRMKRYFQDSIGGHLISFWLDAERYYRQIPLNCHRFVLKEITDKYLTRGSPYELGERLRDQINGYIKSRLLEQGNSQHYCKLLIPMQDLVIKSLEEYWIPKFINHRLKRRYEALGRWCTLKKKTTVLTQSEESQNKTPLMFDLLGKIKQKQNGVDMETSTSEEDLIKKLETGVGTLSLPVGSSNDLLIASACERFKKGPKDDLIRLIVAKKQQQIALEDDLSDMHFDYRSSPLYERYAEKKRKKKLKRGLKKLNASLSLAKDGGTKLRVGIRGDSAGEGREIRTDITEAAVSSDDEDDDPKYVRLPPIEKHYAEDHLETKRKTTLFEALYIEREVDYEADNEDDHVAHPSHVTASSSEESINEADDRRLPIISTLKNTSKSYIAPLIQANQSRIRVQSPFTSLFLKKNTLSVVPDKGKRFQLLTAALMTNPLAGYPLTDHFKRTGDKVAESNLKFWNAANLILTDARHKEPITRQKQFKGIINVYLAETSECVISLEDDFKHELADLLLKDLGVTKLMEACDIIAEKLLPSWEDFLRNDEETFLRCTTKCKRVDQVTDYPMDMLLFGIDDIEYNRTLSSRNINFEDFLNESQSIHFSGMRMWRAMELAISICRPEAEVLPDAKEEEKWSTDDEEHQTKEEETEGDTYGSLTVRNLHLINRKAQRLNQEKLESLFNGVTNIGLVHDYSGAVGAFNNYFAESSGNDEEGYDKNNNRIVNEKNRRQSHARPPRPRNFYDVLNDSTQFDFFKKFLIRERAETPLLFWAAVESMRTMSKTAKARQGRAHGIVKRYFGPSTDYGKHLNCDAEVIREIRQMEKVPPAMLLSAQTCVAKSIEELWFTRYLQTFQEDGGVLGISTLPIYGHNKDNYRCVKTKTRGLWRMFTKNVISFRRGIMNLESLKLFRDFLKLQHQMNLAQFQATNTDAPNGNALPPRIVVNNKLIYTEKLVADLAFWSEVERYKDFADAVVLCAKLGNYTKDDELIVVKKACAIVDCFIDSQISPRIQINITNDLADNIIHLVQNGIIERGLFHEAALSTFSTLIHFWKKFCLYRFLPKEQIPPRRNPIKNDRSAQIATKHQLIKSNKMKRICLPPDEDCPKIMFSLQLGLRIALQRQSRRRKPVGVHLEAASPNSPSLFQPSFHASQSISRTRFY